MENITFLMRNNLFLEINWPK